MKSNKWPITLALRASNRNRLRNLTWSRRQRLKKYFFNQELRPENLFSNLIRSENIDLLCIKARNAMKKYDAIKAHEISLSIIKSDPLYFDIIPIYCSSLLELNYTGEMYYCAHNLIENYPNHHLAWYAIGVYYFMIKKYEVQF